MYKKVVVLFLSFFVSFGIYMGNGTQADKPVHYNAEEIYNRSSSAVFFVRNLGEYNTIRSVGTGVVISQDGLALTAYHVTKNAVELEAVMKDGRTIKDIEIVATDEKNDIALLKIPSEAMKGKSIVTMSVRPNELRHGEHIFALGYPLKGTPMITEGIVNTPDAEINSQSRVMISSQIVSGMSGGPILDEEGHVAGIISGSLRTMPGIHLAIGVEAILALFDFVK